MAAVPMDALRRAWLKYSRGKIYDFKEHVSLAHEMEKRGILPAEFMALEVANPGAENVWDDITRMRTLNSEQARKGFEQHVCPLQLDIVERLIERYSNAGELVLDMFGGIGTVAQQAVLMGRRGYSIELSPEYHRDAVRYCRAAEQKVSMPTLFDFLEPAEAVA
jgi:DNA modification methylase